MKIVMLHELDTGFMAATLKPAFERLGHECIIMQGWKSFLEVEDDIIDYKLEDMNMKDRNILIEEFKDTDFFIIRCGDSLMEDTGVLPYLNKHNMVYRLHGHDLTALGRPYQLKAWQINWHGNEPTVVTYNDPTFYEHYKSIPVYIERPIDLSLIPKKRQNHKKPFVLTSPSGMERKGQERLIELWEPDDELELKIISRTTRDEVLKLKSKCSYFIDNINYSYDGGPYGMNSVEAWLLKVPVFSRYTEMSKVVCPELPKLINNTTVETVQEDIKNYIIDEEQLEYAKQYAIDKHSSDNIACSYVGLYKTIKNK